MMKPTTGQLIGRNLDSTADAMREAATLLAIMRQENEQLKAVVEEQDHKLIDRAMALEEARKIIRRMRDEIRHTEECLSLGLDQPCACNAGHVWVEAGRWLEAQS